MKTLEELREFFAKDNFATQQTGIVIEDAAPGYAKVSIEIDDRHINGIGRVMGGVYFTLADFAASVAKNQDFDEEMSVAMNGQMDFISSASEGKLFAEARIIKDGRKISFCEIKIFDEKEKLIARSNITSYKVKEKTNV
ncbi:MAG: PaaI family thioesterase [Lachnospiraceae bacterium]|nr:PaaI family thioesterase [Lachnospiraceae bacterium]